MAPAVTTNCHSSHSPLTITPMGNGWAAGPLPGLGDRPELPRAGGKCPPFPGRACTLVKVLLDYQAPRGSCQGRKGRHPKHIGHAPGSMAPARPEGRRNGGRRYRLCGLGGTCEKCGILVAPILAFEADKRYYWCPHEPPADPARPTRTFRAVMPDPNACCKRWYRSPICFVRLTSGGTVPGCAGQAQRVFPLSEEEAAHETSGEVHSSRQPDRPACCR